GSPVASVLDYGMMRFRERMRAGALCSTVLETQLYIFARECRLFFELALPADTAKCANEFLPAYRAELLTRGDLSRADVDLWSLKASWDVAKACDRFHAA
ncbi:unnamed protein product, partial [Phaeothamnion confervicola]